MKIKRALILLNNRLENKTEKEVQDELLIIIQSYELLIRYGATNKLQVLADSIYTPKTKLDLSKEAQLKETKKKQTYKKYDVASKLEEDIKSLRKQGMSHANIAIFLSTEKVENSKRKKLEKPYFNKTYIIRFCKGHKIK